jgi:fatty-acyl-CoA synthase
MRGNNVMAGYLADPEARGVSRRLVHSGDLAVWHSDNAIELRDRGKDMISGGENISTIEVEQTVCRHPAVLQCAVVSLPDDRWGERPNAFVTLQAGAAATERDVLDFCREWPAHFKCPDAAEFWPAAQDLDGQVRKFVLRAREWKGRAGRIN